MIPVDSFYQKLNSVRAVVVKRKAILIVVFSHKIPPYLRLCEMDALILAVDFWPFGQASRRPKIWLVLDEAKVGWLDFIEKQQQFVIALVASR